TSRPRTLVDAVEQPDRRVECARVTLRTGRHESSVRAACRLGCQGRRSLQERRCPQETPTCPGALGRMLQLDGNGLVVGDRGTRPMPGPIVCVALTVRDLGQSSVRLEANLEGCRSVGGRANQRVPELDTPA